MSVVLFRRKKAEEMPAEKAPVLSNRGKAFELFAQGKTLDDPEVQALELAPESLKKYFRLWKNK